MCRHALEYVGDSRLNVQDLKQDAEKRFLGALIGLVLIGVSVVAGAWYAAGTFAHQLATYQAESQARIWHNRASAFLTNGHQAFHEKRITPADANVFTQLASTSDIFRITFYTSDGLAFWSTKNNIIGRLMDPQVLNPVSVTGRTQIEMLELPASEIDNAAMRSGAALTKAGDMHHVIRAVSPVVADGKFIGAVDVMFDSTGVALWFSQKMKRAGVIVSIALAVIFVAALFGAYRYSSSRARSIRELMSAKFEAEKSRSELEVVNEKVSKLNRDLQDNVGQLRKAQDEIVRKAKMAQLGHMTAAIAHDLRNPLGAIRTAAYLIERKTTGHELGIEKPLERINNGVRRSDHIITELLDFARTEELELENRDFDSWLTELVQERASRLPESIAIQVHQGLAGCRVAFDAHKMRRVIINFLKNAAEAMVGKPDDPDALTTPDPQIIVATKLTGAGIEVRVTDNGPGIDSENLSNVREPLFTTKPYNVGLGIPTAERILQQHGGGLRIESAPGAGTSMIAWFPDQQVVEEAA
jgi:signal transduction histidine kinase